MEPISVDLHFEERGSGLPLVLIHGFPLDHTIWDKVAEILKVDARVLLPDLRGYGSTPVTDGVYSMGLLAGDILRLLDRLQIERAVIAGHSMGGYVCLALARAHPERVRGLALVTSQAAADSPERKQGRYQLAAEVEKRGVVAVIEANLQRYSPRDDVLEKTREIMLRCNPTAVAASLRGMAVRDDMTSSLASMNIPALVIIGSADALISPDMGREAAQLFPQGRLVTVDGGGHMPMLEAPEVTAGALRDLVKRCGDYG